MEKLIELLNEYKKEVKKDELYEWEKSVCGPFHLFVRDIYDEHHIYSESADTYAISKKYGFIKWLVENDKIDTQNLITYMNGTSLTYSKVPSTDCVGMDKIWNKFYTEVLLMLLSISDTPIEDLISYLK